MEWYLLQARIDTSPGTCASQAGSGLPEAGSGLGGGTYIRVHTMKERNGISRLPSVRICLLSSSFEMTYKNPATFSISFPREDFLPKYAN